MGYTVTQLPVAGTLPNAPVQARLCTSVDYPRTVEVTNSGLAPVWLGHADVQVARGRQLSPGDDPFVFTDGDELYAIAIGATTVVVVEQS